MERLYDTYENSSTGVKRKLNEDLKKEEKIRNLMSYFYIYIEYGIPLT